MKEGEEMRITINLNEEILSKVDAEAKRLGTSRGAMLTTWIGEKVNSLEMSRELISKLNNEEIFSKLLEKAREVSDELKESDVNDL
jgi:hypothetical protein